MRPLALLFAALLASAAFLAPSASAEETCHRLWSGPFSHGDLCADPDQAPRCALWLETHDLDGEETRCYLLPPKDAPAPDLEGCALLIEGHGWSTFLCHDLWGPADCRVWRETRWYEPEHTTRHCFVPDATTGCPVHLVGYGWDSYACYDLWGPKGCKLYTETYWSEPPSSSRTCLA